MQTEYQRLAAAAPPLTPLAAFRPPSLLAACLLLLSISVLSAAQDYEVPQPVIQAFRPKGLKVSIPDSDGVQLFAFHGNVNRPLSQPLEAGDMSADVTRRSGGAWTYHNKQQRLKVGDVLYFWLYVIRDGRGYRLDDQTYQITELLDTPGDDAVPPINRQPEQRPTALSPGSVSPPLTPADCELSATTVNGRQACKGEVVFEENWRTLNLRRWEYEVKISGHPDYEFCIYAQHPENTYVEGGMLHLKPTLTNDKYGADFIRRGKLTLDDCTAGPVNSDSCSREAMFSYILPPVVASRLNTKSSFSFKYGKIEVQAKLPRGDWIYPELWLQPLREEYGPGLSSGRLHLAMARGNRNLRGPPPESEDLSGQLLVVGALAGGKGVGSGGARRKFFSKRKDRGYWADNFHNYTLLWTPETLAFSVDGVELGVARPEELGGLLHGRANEDDPWSSGSRMAPFDKEFYVSLGLAVGGIHAFPDGCRSSSHEKPWKNTGAKAMLSFWNDKDHWFPTWTDQQSEMVVRSVRVTALNN